MPAPGVLGGLPKFNVMKLEPANVPMTIEPDSSFLFLLLFSENIWLGFLRLKAMERDY